MPFWFRTGTILVTLLLVSSVTLLWASTSQSSTVASESQASTAMVSRTSPTPTPTSRSSHQPPTPTQTETDAIDGFDGVAAQSTSTSAAGYQSDSGQLTRGVVPSPTTPSSSPEDPGPATAAPTAQPARLASFAPHTIQIPALEVNARVIPVGVDESGAMDTPRDYDEVAWYQHGATPGELGHAVLAGHVDSLTGPAVFYRLSDLQPGDEIVIGLGAAQESRFVVREIANYRTDLAPVDQIFGESDAAELILITCGGAFDRTSRQYLERVVVYAELVV